MTEPDDEYVPPDPASIDVNDPRAVPYWARVLETPEEKLRRAVRRAGPMLEQVKKELGIAGV